MRVLHVSAYYAPAFRYGGPPRSIHALCRALRHQGVDVQVFTTDANGDDVLPASVTGAAEFENVPVRYFDRTWPRSPIGSRTLNVALRREIGHYSAVHVHGLWNRVTWAAAREATRAGVPYVLSPRGMLEPAARAQRSWRKRAGWTLLDRHVVLGASLLHATSDVEQKTLQALGTKTPVALIPNGIDVDVGSSDTTPRQPVVLFVGRIHPIKRIDLLIDSFLCVRQRFTSARLVIAGPDERNLRSALDTRAGHHEAVEWAGEINEEQRRALLREAAVLVMCSDSESFGMSVLEAMAAGVPVVVTKTCPWSDVERYQAGCWVDQTVAGIASGIARVLGDPQAARAMGERGRALARSTYQWDAIARTFTSYYQSLAPQVEHATV